MAEPLDQTKRKYGPADSCIYCGASGHRVNLTDEHIVPFGLNGQLILPRSSCEKCQEVTCEIERFCLRRMFIQARAHFRMKTRRPKERPDQLPVIIGRGNQAKEQFVPLLDHPFAAAMLILDQAGVISNLPMKTEFGLRAIYVFGAPDFQIKLGTFGPDAGLPFDLSADIFCRMLAKIAHAFAAAELGIDNFLSFLPPIILGESRFISHYVGTCEVAPPSENRLHRLMLHKVGRSLRVRIRLFAAWGTPNYEVVVGDLKGDQWPARSGRVLPTGL
jgi:hypothetical protein